MSSDRPASANSLYFLPVVLQAVLGLLSTGAILAVSGVEAFPEIAVGQAVGAVAWIALSLGYHTTGPTAVAVAKPRDRREILLRSIRLRLVALIPVMLAGALVCLLVAGQDSLLSVEFAVATGVGGLTSSWFFVGTADPIASLTHEAIPRVVPAFAGVGLLLWTSSLHAFTLGQAAGVLWSLVATLRYASRHAPPQTTSQKPGRGWLEDARRQLSMTMVSTINTAVTSLPLFLLTAQNFAVQGQFAVLDKLQKQTAGALTPVSSVMLSGAVKAPPGRVTDNDLVHLARKNARVLLSLCALLAIVMGVLADPAVRILSTGSLTLDWEQSVAWAVWTGTSVLAQAWLPCVLAPLQQARLGVGIAVIVGGATVICVLLLSQQVGLVTVMLLLGCGQLALPLLTTPLLWKARQGSSA